MSKISVAFLLVLLISCGENKTKERPASPRIKKETKVVEPKQNTKVLLGDAITFEFSSKDQAIDSIVVDQDGDKSTFQSIAFDLDLRAAKVGEQRIKSTVYFNGKKETHYSKVVVYPTDAPQELTYEIINTFSHDTEDYTQGLLIADGFMYESTGQDGQSTLEKKNIESGETLEQLNLDDQYFGEGLALVNDQFFQLTYTSGICFVYTKDFEKVKTFSYQGEGWGLTEFNGNLLMTDNTEKMVIRDPVSFTVIDQLQVYDDNGKVDSVNELEIINGMIYANVYPKDIIVVIDPMTGAVVQRIDMSGLLNSNEKREANVLNGIAYDEKTDRIFVTGKLWPKLFEVKFIPKPSVQ